jgi:adenylyltransferase/sulfurtransferase
MTILLVGAGGIGAPAAWALAHAGVRALRVVDDDVVELSNLHRQILFVDEDVGRDKLAAFRAALERLAPDMAIDGVRGRALPHNVLELVASASLVLDATDNFASRFLLADAAMLAGVPIVHAAAVRWHATVMAVAPGGRPCYRCLFEDLPSGDAPDCATAGVVGPVCGVSGALAADLALRILGADQHGDPNGAFGHITQYDGRTDRLRRVTVSPRPDCALCGDAATIGTIDASRYAAAVCEAP